MTVDATGLASSLESSAGRDHLPTALDVYRAGVLLHESWRRSSESSDTACTGSTSRSTRTSNGRHHHHHQQQQDEESSAKEREASESYKSLSSTFRQMVSTLPESYLRGVILPEINRAFVEVVDRKRHDIDDGDVQAISAVFGIYMHSDVACRLGIDDDLCSALATLYDRTGVNGGGGGGVISAASAEKAEYQSLIELIFLTLSSLLLDGLILSGSIVADAKDDDGDYLLRRVLEVVQALTADDTNCCLGDFQEWQKQRRSQTLVQAVQKSLPDNAQRDYLVLMLESSLSSAAYADRQKKLVAEAAKGQKKNAPVTNKRSSRAKTSVNAMDRLVSQVRDVLPALGEGYVETALAIYSFDASRTVSALLEAENDPSTLHPRLRALDKSLPARKKESKSTYDVDDDQEAKELQRARVRDMEKQGEKEAYNMALVERDDMYNDDYDDQYDGIGDDGGAAGEVGGADGGLYDVDLDAMRDYNRVRREEEKEAAFWEESRNLNRATKGKGSSKRASDDEGAGEGEERKYRGPDKGKGGRAIGPDGRYLPIKKGGKKGKKQAAAKQENDNGQKQQGSHGAGKASGGKTTSNSSSDNMTKIQKRRKDANKAKIGNHHRKERAAKKAGRGM